MLTHDTIKVNYRNPYLETTMAATGPVKDKMITVEKNTSIPVTVTCLKFPGTPSEWTCFPMQYMRLYKGRKAPDTMVTEEEWKKVLAEKKKSEKSGGKPGPAGPKGAAAASKAAKAEKASRKRKLESNAGHVFR